MKAYSALFSSEPFRKSLRLRGDPYHGPTHRQLLHKGFYNASELTTGSFESDRGNTSGRIHASRGIGKSTVLITLVPLLHVLYPNVIPVYVDMQDSIRKNHFLHERDI